MLDCTSHSFMNELKLLYKDKVITPYHNAESVMSFLKNRFRMHRIENLEMLDSITLAMTKIAPLKLTENTEIYYVEKDENSKMFYDSFHKHFLYEPNLCILYDKHLGKICSNNCEFLNMYITILHGITLEEIERNSGEYKAYLNSLYLYDCFLEDVEEINRM